MTQLTDKIIAIELPEGAFRMEISIAWSEYAVFYKLPGNDGVHYKLLPPGNWEIVGESDKMDEEGAEKINPKAESGLYPKYIDGKIYSWTTDAVMAAETLLRYKGIETNHLIIKKID